MWEQLLQSSLLRLDLGTLVDLRAHPRPVLLLLLDQTPNDLANGVICVSLASLSPDTQSAAPSFPESSSPEPSSSGVSSG